MVRRRRMGRVLIQAGLRCTTRRRFPAPTASGPGPVVAPKQRNRELTVQDPDTM